MQGTAGCCGGVMCMKITVVFGSHRRTGKNKEIEDMLTGLPLGHELDFIRMADARINGCDSCFICGEEKACVIKDDFAPILAKLSDADAIFILTPVYAPIPSKLTALFERLTSLLFASQLMNTTQNPLHGKPAAIFSYYSSGIADETGLKVIFQKFLMTGYSFHEVNYKYLNNCPNADEKYDRDICEYVKDVIVAM